MSVILALAAVGLGCGAAWLANWRLKVDQLLDEPSPAETEDAARAVDGLPRRVPGASFGPSRAEQVEAVQALCFSSPTYVDARLAAFEAEVSDLAELVLELDDQSPRPTGPSEDY